MRLVKNLYSQDDSYRLRDNGVPGLFGLRSGQVVASNVTVYRNAGWYNHLGQKIGWGDLSCHAIRRIAYGLRKGEAFIILSERDSIWRFRFPDLFKFDPAPPDILEPGVDYVLGHAQMLILPRKVFFVNRHQDREKPREVAPGLWASFIDESSLRQELSKRGLLSV